MMVTNQLPTRVTIHCDFHGTVLKMHLKPCPEIEVKYLAISQISLYKI